MAQRSKEELERELAQCKAQLATLIEEWKHNRRRTVKLLRGLADQIQTHEENCRIAKLSGASASIVGASLAIGGAVGAFFTFGASLGLTVFGGGIAAAGGTTLVGTEIVNSVLRSNNIKLIETALETDNEGTRKVQDELDRTAEIAQRLSTLSSKEIVVRCGKAVYTFGNTLRSGFNAGIKLGKAGSEAGGTVFRTLGTASKALHVAGIAFSAVAIVVDIHTLVSTSIEVHNGSVVEVVKDVRQAAQKLEDQMKVFDPEP